MRLRQAQSESERAYIRARRCSLTKATWGTTCIEPAHRRSRARRAGRRLGVDGSRSSERGSGSSILASIASKTSLRRAGLPARRQRFPALKSLFRTNLPIPANPLVGRKKEPLDVRRLLYTGARLVTITGPAASERRGLRSQPRLKRPIAFPDGVWFVDLSPARDPALVAPMIAHADRGRRRSGSPPPRYGIVLVLDNFEQVVAAARISRRLSACPMCRVLATSREPLRIADEQEYRSDRCPRRRRSSSSGTASCRRRARPRDRVRRAATSARASTACHSRSSSLRRASRCLSPGASREARASAARLVTRARDVARAPASAPRDDRVEL